MRAEERRRERRERRGALGRGEVIYAERAPLPSPLTVAARCSEPEGAQRAGERTSE